MKNKTIPIAMVVLLLIGIGGICVLDPPLWLRSRMAIWHMNAGARSDNYGGDFYGRCVDQSGAGVPEVTIKMDYGTDEGFMHRVPVHLNTITDADGKFQFTGLYGLGFRYSQIERAGYYSWTSRSVFEFNPKSPHHYEGDPANPEIIQMWKRGPEEPLIHQGKGKNAVPNGTPYSFNFFEHIATFHVGRDPAASVIISATNLHREKSKDVKQKYDPTDWRLTVEVPDGGIVETAEPFPYRAPDTGYSPHWELNVSASDPQWNEVKRRFHLKLRGGHAYGLVDVDVTMDPITDKAMLEIGGSVNPAGCRNLEPGGPDIEQ
jgi:hypothetical protein